MSEPLSISYNGSKWRISAGDVDITDAVKALSLIASNVDRNPTVTLDLVGISGLTASEIRKYRIPAQSRAALTALGWTPPPEVPRDRP